MNKVPYDLNVYIDLDFDNLDQVSMPLLEYLAAYFNKPQNLLRGMNPVKVSYREFTKAGPQFVFNFTGEMEIDRNGFPEYDFADFKSHLKMAFEDYMGDPVIVDGEPLSRENQGLIADYAYLDKNTPFPEVTISEMVDGILAGKYLSYEIKDGTVIKEGKTSFETINQILEGKSVRSVLLMERDWDEDGFIYEVKPGDVIRVGGERAVVKDLLFQDVYIVTNKGSFRKSSADVEFKDENGKYRHWQSWSDGGKLITSNGQQYKFEKE